MENQTEQMTNIMENWLQTKTGQWIKLETENVGKWFYDGVLYHKILETTSSLIKCVTAPTPGGTTQEALHNLKMLCPSFKLLGVTHDLEFLTRVASKNKAECLRLLYEIYLKLEDKDNIYLITRQRQNFLFKKAEGRFEVESVNELKPKTDNPTEEMNVFELPLVRNNKVITRYQKLRENLKTQEEIMRSNREKTVKRREKEVGAPLSFSQSPEDANTVDELEEKESSEPSVELLLNNKTANLYKNCQPSQQISYMKLKKKATVSNNKIKRKMISLVIHDLWQGVLKKQEWNSSNVIKKLLLRQSEYEKKLVLKLKKLHNSYLVFLDHKINIERDFKSKVRYSSENSSESNLEEANLEKARILELHCRMQTETFGRVKSGEEEMCRKIVDDLIDFSITVTEYQRANGPLVESFVNDWKELFYKEIPIPESIFNFNESQLKGMDSENNLVGRMNQAEINKTNLVLSKVSVQNYLTCSGEWTIDDEAEMSKSEENLNITGYVVHRLLEKKYSLPQLPRPANCPDFDIRVILSNIHDPCIINALRKMLKPHSIAVVDVNSAVNYCLGIYEKEKCLSKFGIYLSKDSNDFNLKDSAEYVSQTMPESKLNQISAVEVEEEKLQTNIERKIVSNKKTQMPEYNNNFAGSGHTYVGLLGKMLYETLCRGEVLSEVLLAKVIVENIKSFNHYNGITLVGYPSNFNQAALLELLITGKAVPCDYRESIYTEKLNLFGTPITPKPMHIDSSLLNDFYILLSKFLEKKMDSNRITSEQSNVQEEGHNKVEEKHESNSVETSEETPSRKLSSTVSSKSSVSSKKTRSITISKPKSESKSKSPSPSVTSKYESKIFEFTDSVSTIGEVVPSLSNLAKAIPSIKLHELRASKIVPDPQPTKQTNQVTHSYFKNVFVVGSHFVKYTNPVVYCEILRKYGMSFAREIAENGLNGEIKYFEDTISQPEDFYKMITHVQEVVSKSLNGKSLRKLVDLIVDSDVIIKDPFPRFPINISSISNPEESRDGLLHKSDYFQLPRRVFGRLNEIIEYIPSVEWNDYLKVRPTIEDELQYLQLADDEIRSKYILTNVKPGFEGWIYMNEPTFLHLDVALATVWESIEKCYLGDLEKGLSHQRRLKEIVIPYRNAIRLLKETVLVQQDERMNIVNNFQQMFNDVDLDFRKTSAMKNEFHFRVRELRHILYGFADDKREVSNQKRNGLLCDSWISDYVFSLANAFLFLVQIELNRLVDTVQLLNDRYTNMLKGIPQTKRIPRAVIKKLSPLDEDSLPSTSYKKIKIKRDDKASISSRKSGIAIVESSTSTFVNVEDISGESGLNTAHILLSAASRTVGAKIKSILLHSKLLIHNELLGKELRKQGEKRKEKGRLTKHSSKVDTKSRTTTRDGETTKKAATSRYVSPAKFGFEAKDINTLDLLDKIKWEWDEAVLREVDRVNFRTKLIFTKAEDEMNEAVNMIVGVFQEYDKEVEDLYDREIECIDQLCSVFQAAIEDCSPIQPLLVLDVNQFYIDPTNLLFPNQDPPPPELLEEETTECEFKIKQLDKLISKFSHITNNEIIEAGLVSFIFTLIKQNQKDFLPPGWMKLNFNDVKLIFKEALGDIGIMNWKNFILQVINLPLPTIDELLALKNCYSQYDKSKSETITWNQFLEIPLWFDNEFGKTIQEDLHLSLARDLIFKMFQVNKVEMNYTNMLFSFCLGSESIEGFIKALLLLDGDDNLLETEKCFIDLSKTVEARAVAKEFLKETFNNTFHKLENDIVKTLPRIHHYLFESDLREYLETERILALNFMRPVLSESSNSEKSVHSEEKIEDQEEVVLTDHYMHKHPIWHKCVRYDFVLSVLMMALNFYSLSPVHFNWYLQIQTRLKELFKTKGKNELIKVHLLAESDVLNDIFKKTSVFKLFNVVKFVEKLLEKKRLEEENQPPATDRKSKPSLGKLGK